jgi:ABC-type phosphate transport system substrate-binding protein
MKKYRALWLFFFVVSCLVPCYAHHMAVVVNPENPTRDISAADLAKIFKAQTKRWPDGKDVVIVLRGTSGEMVTLQRLNKMTPAQWHAFIEEHKGSILRADSDADVLKLIESNKGAIGLVEFHSITSKIKVLKVGGQLPLEEGYLPH